MFEVQPVGTLGGIVAVVGELDESPFTACECHSAWRFRLGTDAREVLRNAGCETTRRRERQCVRGLIQQLDGSRVRLGDRYGCRQYFVQECRGIIITDHPCRDVAQQTGVLEFAPDGFVGQPLDLAFGSVLLLHGSAWYRLHAGLFKRYLERSH
jgi:hypothetical protein